MLDALPIPLWQIVAGVFAVVLALRLARKLLSGGGSDQHISGLCSCGWKGQVSKYRPICPKCGTRLTPN